MANRHRTHGRPARRCCVRKTQLRRLTLTGHGDTTLTGGIIQHAGAGEHIERRATAIRLQGEAGMVAEEIQTGIASVPVILKFSIRLKVAICTLLFSDSSVKVIFCASRSCFIRLPINIFSPNFMVERLNIGFINFLQDRLESPSVTFRRLMLGLTRLRHRARSASQHPFENLFA